MATDFEGHTHQQLKAMSDALKPETVKARAEQLKKASEDIAKIAEKLKKHRVTGWEGESATAFQEWVGRAGNATLRLSEYSEQGSHWMTQAVQKMVEAQGMPAYDTDAAANLEAARKYHNDPDAAALGSEARSKLNSELTEAKKRMKALAEAYELSSQQMNKAEIPTFPPPPAAFVPRGIHDISDISRSGDATNGGTSNRRGVEDTYSPPSSRDGVEDVPNAPRSASAHPPQSDGQLPSVQAIPDREVSVDLDNVATLPATTQPQTANPPVTSLPGGPGGGVNPVGVVPPLTLPPVGGVKGPGPGGIGPVGGTLPVTAGPGGPGARAGHVGGLPGMAPRDSGITGGRPVASGGPHAGIPRGTVIGAEGAHAAQGARGMGMGGGMGGPHGAPAGSVAGRRLAMEAGGVVGGRPAGPVGRPVAGGQPFTQGGSGLVRSPAGGAGAGAMGHGGAGARTPGKRREDRGGERPDYLAEDEETWLGSRRVVPPVID
ncbi:hypothetical protein [Streptomyces subrutilus]|uniref:WXG100 family type VII secretion target n=1 Tax=Streptomyces subrutilus TaxID=36818 RepID=UPI002E0EF30B|nr:hypothetical protein OG479_13965 [Streptomyces subrutilus]